MGNWYTWATRPQDIRALQTVIVVIVVFGLFQGNFAIVINGVLGLLTTFVPAILRRDYQIHLDPPLVWWITIAIILHTLGMVGPYESVWWWDHITHTLSATIVAIVGYSVTRAIDEYWERIYLPDDFLIVFTILFTLAAGVLWEVLEFVSRELAVLTGQGPFLIQYDVRDSVIDIVFDGIGGVIVAVIGHGRFDRLVESIEAAIARAHGEDDSRR
ncbi:MAG: hypothetical protein ABEJ58_09765 [Halodesulfurarchaeum sp.]